MAVGIGNVGIFDCGDGPVDNSKGKRTDDEANKGIENGIFGFLSFGRIARRSHIVDPAADDVYYGDDAGY